MDLHNLAFNFDAKMAAEIQKTFGERVAARLKTECEKLVQEIVTCLQFHIDRGNLGSTLFRIETIRQKLIGRKGLIVDEIRGFFTSTLGNREEDDLGLQKKWHALVSELIRLGSLRPDLDQIALISAEIERSSALLWAARIRTQAAEIDHDPVVPSDWREAMEWRCAVALLDSIDVHHQLRNLFEEVLSGYGECGLDLEFLDLLYVCEEIDYELDIGSHGQFLGTWADQWKNSGEHTPSVAG